MAVLTRVSEKSQTISAPKRTFLSPRAKFYFAMKEFGEHCRPSGGHMKQIAAWRAEWFVRLAEAIEGAQRVAWQLRTSESASEEARELYSRLENARLELESLRQVEVRQSDKTDIDWLKRLGWSGSLRDEKD